MKKEEIDQLVKNLKSPQESIALKAIEDVRKNGDDTILPVLAKLLSSSESAEVNKGIRSVFNDLKDPRSATAITEMIADPDFASQRAFLVASCWESKVDYSSFLPFFTDLVIDEELAVSIEALTVIEEMPGPFDGDDLMASLDRVHEYLEFPTNENEPMVENLLEILQARQSNISE